jgi:hypothetical protein
MLSFIPVNDAAGPFLIRRKWGETFEAVLQFRLAVAVKKALKKNRKDSRSYCFDFSC